MSQRGALRRQEAGGRRQEAGGRRQETPEGFAAFFSNLVETHVT